MVSDAVFDAHYHNMPTATEAEIRDGTSDTVAMSPLGFAPIYAELTYASATLGTAATEVTADETTYGVRHQTVLTVLTTLPAIAGGADLAVGVLLYTLPAGTIIVESARMALAITQSEGNINADTPDGGLGTTIGSGANATLDAVSAAAENILTGQTFNNCTGTVEDATVANQPLVITTAGDHTVYFNVADGWAASGDAAAALAGTVTLNWTYMGA